MNLTPFPHDTVFICPPSSELYISPFLLSLSRLHHAAKSSWWNLKSDPWSTINPFRFWQLKLSGVLPLCTCSLTLIQTCWQPARMMWCVCVVWLWCLWCGCGMCVWCVCARPSLALCGCVSSILAGRNLGPFLLSRFVSWMTSCSKALPTTTRCVSSVLEEEKVTYLQPFHVRWWQRCV